VKQDKGAKTLADLEAQGRLFCTPAQAAVVLGRDYRTILAAVERGEVPSVRVGQRYSISVGWLRKVADGVTT
jgi:excisionase family DNA binding protein